MVGARVRRQQFAYAQGRGLSGRRACAVLSVARSTLGYVSRLIARDAPVLPAMRTLAGQYPRYGYRTIRIFLDRQGHGMSADRMYRLWRQEALQVPKQRPRRRVATSRPRPLPPTAVNHVWAYDFVFDTCADGRTLKCLTVIDEFTRECLAIDVAGGIRSGRVIDVLTQLVSVHGAPRYMRSDNGPEFVARAILKWLQTAAIETAFIDPREAVAEWHRRIVQREIPERTSLAAVVSQPRRREGRHRAVAPPLQRGSSALESGVPHPAGVQSELCGHVHRGALAGCAGSR
jgi:putative transposase